LTPQKLLEKSVGSAVRVITTNPATGDETTEDAVVLSVANGIVLRIGDRIETASPGRIVFGSVPANLRARPTLIVELDSPKAGPADLALAYLTGGLSWKADYVAELGPDERTIDLSGLVTLTNTSGTTYAQAKLQLVAGNINQVQPALAKAATQANDEVLSQRAPMREESLFEYHLYSLDRPTTIADNQTKQVALMSALGVPVSKDYRFIGLSNRQNTETAEPERANASVWLSFTNEEAAHLGMPLPMGIIRVYKKDSEGKLIFAGEDRIEHTPKGETVKLNIGEAFDVTGTSRQTDYERISDHTAELAYEVVIRNAKPTPITATVIEQYFGQVKVLAENVKHEARAAATFAWPVAVPANGKATLTYRVRITQ